jgi:hypothetical protein
MERRVRMYKAKIQEMMAQNKDKMMGHNGERKQE